MDSDAARSTDKPSLLDPRMYLTEACDVALTGAVLALLPLSLLSRATDALLSAAMPDGVRLAPRHVSPVLLVHGYGATKSCWAVLQHVLQRNGFHVATFNYVPLGTSLDRLANRLADKVELLLAETGAEKVHLVGHSLGGVLIRAAMTTGRLEGKVNAAVTVASPHRGSPVAQLLPIGATARALRPGSRELRRIEEAEPSPGVRWTAYFSEYDLIVPGRRARLYDERLGARNVLIADAGHIGVIVTPKVIDAIVRDLLDAETDEGRPRRQPRRRTVRRPEVV